MGSMSNTTPHSTLAIAFTMAHITALSSHLTRVRMSIPVSSLTVFT